MTEDLHPRLRAACALLMSEVREFAGRHEYDGQAPDLSIAGVRASLAKLGQGGRLDDSHDEAHLTAVEEGLRVSFGELELHRRNPLPHLEALDLACYDRDYAPQADRHQAKLAHLARWPEVIEAAIATLDAVPAPVAAALLNPARGLAAGIPAGAAKIGTTALAAHEKLIAHLSAAAEHGPAEVALGGPALARLMGAAEAIEVDLTRLSAQADAERDRLHERLAAACARIDPSRAPLELCRELVRDHPDIDGILAASRHWTEKTIAFTRERDLVPYHDGECLVGPAPESRRWAMAMMTSAAPGEPEGPSWYHISPPDPTWPQEDIDNWLEVFSATTLPGITVHEVAPGHFSHGRALRRARTPVRRVLQSMTFVEGWAHYAEELCVEEGFEAGDPRFEIGVWLAALIRVTRLACAIAIHTGAMTPAEGAARFAADTQLAGSAALAEANRAMYDPAYGRYTWGKFEILALRERARKEWGAEYSHKRFHTAMFELGSPPLGLIAGALR